MEVYQGKEKSEPTIIREAWDPSNTSNFIEVNNDKAKKNYDKRRALAFVHNGDEGLWATNELGASVPHEFAHLLGLADRYHKDENGYAVADEGWQDNIMTGASAIKINGKIVDFELGKVEQKNIDAILKRSLDKHAQQVKDHPASKDKEVSYTIDDVNPKQ